MRTALLATALLFGLLPVAPAGAEGPADPGSGSRPRVMRLAILLGDRAEAEPMARFVAAADARLAARPAAGDGPLMLEVVTTTHPDHFLALCRAGACDLAWGPPTLPLLAGGGEWELLLQEDRHGDVRAEADARPSSRRGLQLLAAVDDLPDGLVVVAAPPEGGAVLEGWGRSGARLSVALLPPISTEGHLVPLLALEAAGFDAARLDVLEVTTPAEAAAALAAGLVAAAVVAEVAPPLLLAGSTAASPAAPADRAVPVLLLTRLPPAPTPAIFLAPAPSGAALRPGAADRRDLAIALAGAAHDTFGESLRLLPGDPRAYEQLVADAAAFYRSRAGRRLPAGGGTPPPAAYAPAAPRPLP